MPKFSVLYVVTDTYRIEIEAATAEEAEEIVQENSHDEREADHIETLEIQVESVTPVIDTCPDCFATDGKHTRASCAE